MDTVSDFRLQAEGSGFGVVMILKFPFSFPLSVGSIPHPVMGTTRDYCRYIKALLTPY